jgi:hypothetical protein
MRTLCALLLGVLLAGCSIALKRDGQCLASLAPEFVQTREELAQREAAWREALARRRAESAESSGLASSATNSLRHAVSTSKVERTSIESDREGGRQTVPETERDAYAKLAEARTRHRTTVMWFEKVYTRIHTRLDEEAVLSQTLMTLVTSPAVVFYPIIRWNIRSVFWDGTDPDAESDPVTKYCTDRLSAEASAEARARAPGKDGSVAVEAGPGREGGD